MAIAKFTMAFTKRDTMHNMTNLKEPKL